MYFTPRYVIDMCVKMLNPQEHETMIDTAAGSCGFPVHTIFHVWKQIFTDMGLAQSHLFTLEQKPPRCTDYVNDKVFAIDFDEKTVRVARTMNLIAGDGQTNVLHLNTLDWERWDEKTNDGDWQDVYGRGWTNIKKLRTVKNNNRDFQFDILMANPPLQAILKRVGLFPNMNWAKTQQANIKQPLGAIYCLLSAISISLNPVDVWLLYCHRAGSITAATNKSVNL